MPARGGTELRTLITRMPFTLRVGNVPGGDTEFITIQAAIDYAATQAGNWTIEIYPGTYNEQIIMAPGVNLVGIDKGQCIILVTGGMTAITMAEGCEIRNLSLDVTGDATGWGYGIEMNDHGGTIEDVNIVLTRTAGQAYGICNLFAADTARTIYIRNVRITSTGILCEGIYCSRAAKVFYIENCWVDVVDGLTLTGASTAYSSHNHWEGSGFAVQMAAAGVIQMTEDAIIGAVSQIGGTMTYRDAHDVWHVFEGMVIQDSLTAGAGGEVVIHAGTHTPPNPGAPGPALTIAADTLVRGEGKATIIQGAGAAGNINNLVLLNGNNITMKDMKLELLAGCGTAAARPNVVYATGRTLLWLENLWTVGDTSVADDGSAARQNGICFLTVTDSKIANCRIEDNDRSGIYANASTGNTITGNTCQGNTVDGIFLMAVSNYNTITGNIVQGNGQAGVYVVFSDHNAIVGNVAQGNLWGIVGDNADNDDISGNICQSNTQYGIWLTSSTENTVTGNTCHGNTRDGIYVLSSLRNTITGNNCADNDSAGATYSGIFLGVSNENVITGNLCQANGNHGIYLFRSSYCSITGNVCNNQTTGDGINITGDATADADENVVSSNVCRGNGDDGIEIAGAANADRNIVLGNQLLGNTGAALVNGGANTEIAHNITV